MFGLVGKVAAAKEGVQSPVDAGLKLAIIFLWRALS
jgi:hypothetical protein